MNIWGKQALSLSVAHRNYGDAYRVLALDDGTVVSTNGVTATTLQSGGFFGAIVNGPVQFQGTHPIQVAHLANGEGYDNPPGYFGGATDMLLPPTAEYSTAYTVSSVSLAASLSLQTNFLNILVASNAAQTTLDGTNLNIKGTNFFEIGNSGYVGARIAVLPGAHTITCSEPLEVEVYGFAYFTAYGYPGGCVNLP